jgi:hypothetical protein
MPQRRNTANKNRIIDRSLARGLAVLLLVFILYTVITGHFVVWLCLPAIAWIGLALGRAMKKAKPHVDHPHPDDTGDD